MIERVMLDTGPLGRLAHPNPSPEIVTWLRELLLHDVEVFVPEIADYELRRNLILEDMQHAIKRLDQLVEDLTYLPLSTSAMRKAAALWAETRKRGRPTAHPKGLDGDVILAAQALEVGAVIATENVNHLTLFTAAKRWRDLAP